MNSIAGRLQLIFVISVLAVAVPTIGLSIRKMDRLVADATEIKKSIAYDRAASELESLIENTLSIYQSYHNKAKAGDLSLEDARQGAIEAVGALRYADGSGYYWQQSYDRSNPRKVSMVLHPVVERLNGTDISGFRYNSGPSKGQVVMGVPHEEENVRNRLESSELPLFQSFNDMVVKNGSGVVSYDWPKPTKDGLTEFQPKWSYVAAYEPFGVVVGTGFYVDDIESQIASSEATLTETVASSRSLLFTFSLVATAVAAALVFFTIRWLKGRLRSVGEGLENIAQGEGDLTVRLDESRQDEVGQLAGSFNRFVERIQTLMQNLGGSIQGLNASAEHLLTQANSLNGESSQMRTQSSAVSGSTDQVNQSVQSVAAAVEEMNVTVTEVARNTSEASDIANEGVRLVMETNAKISRLGDSSEEIGEVIRLINSIAEQTNLLALNATIEAARAGEAGRGFAVVANEVKDLANETSKATQSIAAKVETIQSDVKGVISEIQRVEQTMQSISANQTGIAGAVEEQLATTQEMGRAAEIAATRTGEIATSLDQVAGAAERLAGVTGQSSEISSEVRGVSQRLEGLAGQFKY